MTINDPQKAIEALIETIGEIKEISQNTDLFNLIVESFEKKVAEISNLETTDEGFIESLKTIYLRLDNQHNPPWYIWNTEKQQKEYIEKNRPKLRGRLSHIAIKEDRNGSLNSNISKLGIIPKKAIIYLNCREKEGTKRYGIVAGHTTVFSRQFIWKIHQWMKENRWYGKELKLSILAESITSPQTGKRYIGCILFDENENRLIVQNNPPEDWTDIEWDQYVQKAAEEINSAIAGNDISKGIEEEAMAIENFAPKDPSIETFESFDFSKEMENLINKEDIPF